MIAKRLPVTFIRKIEDFTCERCGLRVEGSGYTNHCPKCLWSKHVDVEPGDRAAPCGGMMKPVALEGASPRYRLVHRCTLCGLRRVNDIAVQDDASAMLEIAGKR